MTREAYGNVPVQIYQVTHVTKSLNNTKILIIHVKLKLFTLHKMANINMHILIIC